MINRAAVILTGKPPLVEWLNAVEAQDEDGALTLAEVNEDATVYLITDEDADHLEEWVALNYSSLFESELEDWCTDEALWPQKRSKEVFLEWFSVACHTVIFDTVGTPIVDEDSQP